MVGEHVRLVVNLPGLQEWRPILLSFELFAVRSRIQGCIQVKPLEVRTKLLQIDLDGREWPDVKTEIEKYSKQHQEGYQDKQRPGIDQEIDKCRGNKKGHDGNNLEEKLIGNKFYPAEQPQPDP